MRRYGSDLVCVRYRYDADARERLKTVEIVVERVGWSGGSRAAVDEQVHVRIREDEELLRRALLFAGGRWVEESNTWTIARSAAASLGLSRRILRVEKGHRRSTVISRKKDSGVDRKDHR